VPTGSAVEREGCTCDNKDPKDSRGDGKLTAKRFIEKHPSNMPVIVVGGVA